MKLNHVSLEEAENIIPRDSDMEVFRYVEPLGVMTVYSVDHKFHQLFCLDRVDKQYELAAVWDVESNTLHCLPCFHYSDNQDRLYLHFKGGDK